MTYHAIKECTALDNGEGYSLFIFIDLYETVDIAFNNLPSIAQYSFFNQGVQKLAYRISLGGCPDLYSLLLNSEVK